MRGKTFIRRLGAGVVAAVTAWAGVAATARADYTWARTVSSYGSTGTSSFTIAESVTVDPSGNVWATDGMHTRLVKFDGSGNYLGDYSVGNYAGGVHSDPWGNIWVAGVGAISTVTEFNSSGAVVKQLGAHDSNLRSFQVLNAPSDVAVDSAGNMWVADQYGSSGFPSGSLEKFSSGGAFIGQYGQVGSSYLNSPWGLTLDASGNVWVSDSGNGRIVEFNNSGAFLQQFGSQGTGNGQLSQAEGLAFDAAGNLWIADGINNRIEEFSSSGAYLGQFGSYGTGPGQFKDPQGVAFDAAGNMWVADSNNSRLQEFSPVPEPSTLILLAAGAVGVLAYAWRRRKQAM